MSVPHVCVVWRINVSLAGISFFSVKTLGSKPFLVILMTMFCAEVARLFADKATDAMNKTLKMIRFLTSTSKALKTGKSFVINKLQQY